MEEKETKATEIATTKKPHKGGRVPVWDSVIVPNKDAIIEAIGNGASETQISAELGISHSAWVKAKKEHKELKEWIDIPRGKLVNKLRGALISRALGYQYEEEITEIRQDVDENDQPIGKRYIYKRKVQNFAPPDPTSIFACLKIYDKENGSYDDKARMIAIKKEELELKKKMAQIDTGEDTDLIEQLKDFKIEVVDASKKDGRFDDKGN